MKMVGIGGSLLLVLFIIIPLLALAAEFRTGDQPSLAAGQTVNNDLYMAGGNVTASGSVQGDLTAAGGNVLLNGPVSADVLAAGGTITLLGDVTGDVRFGGGNVTIQGAVAGDVLGGGGQVSLVGPRIGGDVAIGGGQVTIDAPITGTVHVGGGDVRINAPITGNVFVQAEKLTLGPKAALNGNLTYSASEPAEIQGGAVVRGATEFNERADRATKAGVAAGLVALFTLWMLAKFFMLLLGAAALAYFFHRYSRELVATAAVQPWMEMFRGLVTVIVLPVASLVLLASVIGIPLGILGLLTLAILCIFAHLAAPIIVGSVIHKWWQKPAGYVVSWKTVLLGVVVFFLLGIIPVLGWIIKAGIMLITLGAALNIKWSIAKEWR